MSTKRYCLQCDDGTELVHETRDVHGQVRGEPYTVPQVTGWHCPACGEIEFSDGEADRYDSIMRDAAQRANARAGMNLRAIRKKLGLKQAEAGQLFGGGPVAFSNYERGKTQPHKSTVLLLHLLDRHPELLAELQQHV